MHSAFAFPDLSPAAPPELPQGITLQQWLDASNLRYSDLARLLSCSLSYPRLLAQGLAIPSYEMAILIEQVTGGLVHRTQWYPAGSTAPGRHQHVTDIKDILE